MGEERVGSRFKRKAPIGAPSVLSNLSRHKKSNSLIPKGILRERKGVIGESSLCWSVSSSFSSLLQPAAPHSAPAAAFSVRSSKAQVSLFILRRVWIKLYRCLC